MDLDRNKILSQLRQMDEYEFEYMISDIWNKRGWETTVTSGSNDRGIDVIAEKNSAFTQKHLIQAKRYSTGNKIGSPDIQQYSSLRQQEDDVDAVIIVTTSSFTTQAERSAKDLNVKLMDGDDLIREIFDLDSTEFLSKHLQKTASNTHSQKTVTNTISRDDVRDEINSKLTKAQKQGGRFRATWRDGNNNKHSLITQYGKWNVGGLIFGREKISGAKIEIRPRINPETLSNVSGLYKVKNDSQTSVEKYTSAYTNSEKTESVEQEVGIIEQLVDKNGIDIKKLQDVDYLPPV